MRLRRDLEHARQQLKNLTKDGLDEALRLIDQLDGDNRLLRGRVRILERPQWPRCSIPRPVRSCTPLCGHYGIAHLPIAIRHPVSVPKQPLVELTGWMTRKLRLEIDGLRALDR